MKIKRDSQRVIKKEEVIFEKVCKKIVLGCFLLFAIGAPISYMSNTEADKVIAQSTNKYESDIELIQAERNQLQNYINDNMSNIKLDMENDLKVQSIRDYLDRINAIHLKGLQGAIVFLSQQYGKDSIRVASIIIHETKDNDGIYGNSYALRVQNNVCGMNWTEKEKKLIGIKSDIYNVKEYKYKENSILDLVLLLNVYQNTYNATTLSEIQPIYAPESDSRQGLDGMDNTIWFKATSKHYNAIEAIYQAKLKESGLK